MDDYAWIHIPVGYLYCIDNPRTDWRYKTEAEAGLNGRSLLYPRGKVLGGSSSINGMIYMRGQKHDYDDWAAAGNPGWSWDDVLPLFRKSENHWALDDAALRRSLDDEATRTARRYFHGHDGEWRVEKQRLHWDILDAFRDAAAQAGIPQIEDFNRGDNFGLRLLRGQPEARHSLECIEGVPASAAQRQARAPERRAGDRGARHDARVRRPDLRGRALPTTQCRVRCPRPRRDHPVRRIDRFAGDPATRGHRRPGHAAGRGHRSPPCIAWCRREPAGPSATADGVQAHERTHAQHDRQCVAWQGLDGDAIHDIATRADGDGAEPARCVREEHAGSALRERPVSRAAAFTRPLRFAAACLRGIHGVGLQPATGVARDRAGHLAGFHRRHRRSRRTTCRPRSIARSRQIRSVSRVTSSRSPRCNVIRLPNSSPDPNTLPTKS